jgi:glycosyltransferase involved in cell wall biosynthesis
MSEIGKIQAPGGPAVSLALDVYPMLWRSAGVKNYLYYWARSLAANAGHNTLRFFPFLNDLGEFSHEKSVVGPLATLSRIGLLFAANRCPFPLLSWLAPPTDVFHCSHQVLNPPRKARLTSTIYDMTCWLMPEVHRAANLRVLGRLADRLFRPAHGLIAISECTRADAVRVLGLAPEKIEVIYPGIAHGFFDLDPGEARETARRYRLVKPYALYVGTIEPRKNVGLCWKRGWP